VAEETVYCRPEDLGKELSKDLGRHVEDQRRMLTRGLDFLQAEMRRQAPRGKGDFADSIQPYRGEPDSTWKRGGGGDGPGAEDVMAGWQPPEEVGVATDAPYGRKLIFHAGEEKGVVSRRNRRGRRVATGKRRTYTTKASPGWVEKIVDQANREMERED
jgi:hypothetical protein